MQCNGMVCIVLHYIICYIYIYIECLEFHVVQATAAYSLKAEHPLFFYWTEDATAEMDSFRDNGYKCPLTMANEDHKNTWGLRGWWWLLMVCWVPVFFCIFLSFGVFFLLWGLAGDGKDLSGMKQKHQKYGMVRRLQGLCRHTRIK